MDYGGVTCVVPNCLSPLLRSADGSVPAQFGRKPVQVFTMSGSAEGSRHRPVRPQLLLRLPDELLGQPACV